MVPNFPRQCAAVGTETQGSHGAEGGARPSAGPLPPLPFFAEINDPSAGLAPGFELTSKAGDLVPLPRFGRLVQRVSKRSLVRISRGGPLPRFTGPAWAIG